MVPSQSYSIFNWRKTYKYIACKVYSQFLESQHWNLSPKTLKLVSKFITIFSIGGNSYNLFACTNLNCNSPKILKSIVSYIFKINGWNFVVMFQELEKYFWETSNFI